MLLGDFIETYGPQGASVDMESGIMILKSVFEPTRIYKNQDAVVAVFDHGDHSRAYLIFARFSKRVATLIRDFARAEVGDLVAETKDHRITKLLSRFGFVVTNSDAGTETLRKVRICATS